MKELTAQDVINLISDRVQWCRENGETDMRNILNTLRSMQGMLNDKKTRDEILEYFTSEDEEEF